MASFQVKTGWKRPRKREYKNYRSVSFQPEPKQKIKKKIAKKFNDLKSNIIASFQAKIGWKTMKNRKNKNYHYISFLPEA